MKGVNKVILVGNVGKDPEMKYTQGGTAIANLSLATADRKKDRDGNWQDVTEWHSLIGFQKTAEIIKEYVKKGSRIYVEGKLQTRSWEQDGQKKYKTEIVINDLVLLGEKPTGGATAAPKPAAPKQQPEQDNTFITNEDLSDIPF